MTTKIEIENELLRNTFKGNDHLLKTMRSLFFGFHVKPEDKILIKTTFTNEALREAVRKKFYAKPGDEVEIGQIADFWIGIPDDKIVGMDYNTISQIIEPRKNFIKMTGIALALLEKPDGKKVDLVYSPEEDDELRIGLLSRNKFMNVIEAGLNMIKMVAEMKNLSPDEQEKITNKNSSK